MILTTGVGSLPFKDRDEALEYVFSNYSLPFLPELPHDRASKTLNESSGIPPMIERVLPIGLKNSIENHQLRKEMVDWESYGNSAAQCQEIFQDPHNWGCLAPFLKRARDADKVKLQVAGPVTLGLYLQTAGGIDPEVAEKFSWLWVETLSRALIAHITPQLTGGIHLFWDEPGLSAKQGPAVREKYRTLQKSLGSPKVKLGIHCCGPLGVKDLSGWFGAGTVGVDAGIYGSDLRRLGEECAEHTRGGGSVAIGLVDTGSEQLDLEGAIARGRQCLLAVREGSLGWEGGEMILTGACGTAGRSLVFEELTAQVLGTIKALSTAL